MPRNINPGLLPVGGGASPAALPPPLPPTPTNAVQLRARTLSTNVPADGYVYAWDVATATWRPAAGGASPLSDTNPLPTGTAAPGLAATGSRYDHVHLDPTRALDAKNAVYAVDTTGGVTLVGPQGVGGVLPPDGSRVLLTAQSTGSENTLWITNDAGAWTLAADGQLAGQLEAGSKVYCQHGSNLGRTFVNTTSGAIIPGVTTQTWVTAEDILPEPVYIPLGGFATADAVSGLQAVGGSGVNFNPADWARPGLTLTAWFVFAVAVTNGQTGTLILYDNASGAEVVHAGFLWSAQTAAMSGLALWPGYHNYEVRMSCSGSTAADYAIIWNSGLRLSWSL